MATPTPRFIPHHVFQKSQIYATPSFFIEKKIQRTVLLDGFFKIIFRNWKSINV